MAEKYLSYRQMCCYKKLIFYCYCSHIYQPVVDSLIHVAEHLEDKEKRYDLLCRSLKLFVQQGIEAKRASERAEAPSTHKVK